MSYPKPHLNAARRRARKRTLARRDGRHCTFCRVLFAADLRDATIDHVVPISLFVTWRAENLVLACRPCNTTKGDRLPLSIAVLLCPTPGVDWPLLARLAHAQESADRSTLPIDQRSMCDLPVRPDRSGGDRAAIRRPSTCRLTPVDPASTPVNRAAGRLAVPDRSTCRSTAARCTSSLIDSAIDGASTGVDRPEVVSS
ncbi:HNH endonuclease [Streptomyces sp. NPDC004296]|uniref:HNH endonuclease n=1 Tax=Streptomyces sp. NPDC004296 TaxID=3364697 RepID=UPI003696CD41